MKQREAYFDNAKFILIFLVVFGHVIQPFTADAVMTNTLYMWMYTFHMPAFILIAGFFAKGSGNFDYIKKLAKKLLIPYMIFQVIYTIYYFSIGKPGYEVEIFYPHWSLWFLISLFGWHVLLIIFKKIPAVFGIGLALSIGVVVGYFPEIGHEFSLSRTFVFFPFFLLGYWLKKEHFLYLTKKPMKIMALGMMAIVALFLYMAPDFQTGWLLASKSYADLGLPESGGLARLGIYIIAAWMVIAVFAWIPKKSYRFTSIGERSLYVYLLHGFIVQYFRQQELFQGDHVFYLIGLAALSLALVYLLSSRPIQALTEPVIELKASYFKKYVSNPK